MTRPSPVRLTAADVRAHRQRIAFALGAELRGAFCQLGWHDARKRLRGKPRHPDVMPHRAPRTERAFTVARGYVGWEPGATVTRTPTPAPTCVPECVAG